MRRQKHDCCIKTEKQFYVGSRVFNGMYSLRYRALRKDRSGKAARTCSKHGTAKKAALFVPERPKEKII